MSDEDKYDFLVTDDGDVMLIMTSKPTTVEKPQVTLLPMQNKIILKRNSDDMCVFNAVHNNIFDELAEEESLLVCEVKPANSPDEIEIVRTYVAEITEKNENY